eukprot:8841963-Heterocapsa_arctica.AAC.1
MHVVLQRGDPLPLLRPAPPNVNPLPRGSGGAGNAGHDMGSRMPCDVTEGGVQRLLEPEV